MRVEIIRGGGLLSKLHYYIDTKTSELGDRKVKVLKMTERVLPHSPNYLSPDFQ